MAVTEKRSVSSGRNRSGSVQASLGNGRGRSRLTCLTDVTVSREESCLVDLNEIGRLYR
jgi:hypothetical protein